MPVVDAPLSEVRVWVSPLDPQTSFRRACALNQSFAKLLSPDKGESASTEAGSGTPAKPASKVLPASEWADQKAIKDVIGPLKFVRLLSNGTVETGARAAAESDPREEICGFTLGARRKRLHSSIIEPPPPPGAPDVDLRPRFPQGEPVLEWVPEQGNMWERLVPARVPAHGAIRHRAAPANRTVKAKTKGNWGKNAPLGVVFDLGGVAHGHIGSPAIRFEWGGRYSIVLRGVGQETRPVIERRSGDKDGDVTWRVWRSLEGAPALTQDFWNSRHQVFISRLAGLLLVTWNDKTFWIGEERKGEMVPINWKAAPLRISVVGCDNLLQIFGAEFSQEAKFSSESGVDSPPLFDTSFTLTGPKSHLFSVAGSSTGGTSTSSAPTSGSMLDAVLTGRKGLAKMIGTDLEQTTLEGEWKTENGEGRVAYTVTLKGEPESPPLLCAFAALFPPTATGPLPAPIDLRPVLQSLDVESGEPERLPSTEARFTVAVPLLEQFVPRWREVLLPFREVHIEVDSARDGNYQTIFWGYVLPEGISSDSYHGEVLSLVARDPKLRLREPAALVDSRFVPLDLLQPEHGLALYGAQCVKFLIGLELGVEAALSFNGNGYPMRWYDRGHYPLMGGSEGGYFTAVKVPKNGDYLLPPPFGEDVERWIGKVQGFDRATFFFDPREGEKGAWMYGDISKFFAERGEVVYKLHHTTENFVGDSVADWPLVSSYNGQSLIDKAYTRVRVWGSSPEGTTGSFMPSLVVGAAGAAPDPFSADPLSENQSWPRTLLIREEFIGNVGNRDYPDSIAWRVWSEFEGRAPERWEFTLRDQILPARWGEKLSVGLKELRIVKTKHIFSFSGDGERRTEITARSLSARGL